MLGGRAGDCKSLGGNPIQVRFLGYPPLKETDMTAEEWAMEMLGLGDRMNRLLEKKPKDVTWYGSILAPKITAFSSRDYYVISQDIKKTLTK